MDVGVLRDFVITIGGLLLLVLVIVTGIIAFLLYRQVKALTTTINSTITLTKEMTSEVKQAIKASKDMVSAFKGNGGKKES
jgi:hypothetical protein